MTENVRRALRKATYIEIARGQAGVRVQGSAVKAGDVVDVQCDDGQCFPETIERVVARMFVNLPRRS